MDFSKTQILIIILWFFFTIIQIINLVFFEGLIIFNLIITFLYIIPGVIGLFTLFRAGFRRQDCFLEINPISKTGAIALGSIFLYLPIILITGTWKGFDILEVLLIAPISGFCQELFFRGVLFPMLLKTFDQKENPFKWAVSIHSIFFGIWHIGVIWIAPIQGAIFVILIPTLFSILWAWQVQKDGTLVYITIIHIVVLVIMSFFTW